MPMLVNIARFMTRMIMMLAGNFLFLLALLVAMAVRIKVAGRVAGMVVMRTGLFLRH